MGSLLEASNDAAIYTCVTFAPVQSFILASRKLRDLYGSSLLLSHLARAIADDVTGRQLQIISPASVNSSRGVPNVMVIEGDYRKGYAQEALLICWKHVLDVCQQWLEEALSDVEFNWQSSWKACGCHAWELFHGQGVTIQKARAALAVNKQQRDWSVPNWTGESSTLSSADAVVWPGMGEVRDPRYLPPGLITDKARSFLARLREHPKLGEAFAGRKEEISISELVKRLITYPDVARSAFATVNDPKPVLEDLLPKRFQNLSMIAMENEAEIQRKPESIVWFMADGDGIGEHLEGLNTRGGEKENLQSFSRAMREWASDLYRSVPLAMNDQAMVVYAGGDDLFGALHESRPGANDLYIHQLWDWLLRFPEIWSRCDQDYLTVSMGLVWADAQVPQREALQHAREAEANAKARGKNRFALRLLYASGNHLEWTCPWTWLDPILSHYTDREGRTARKSHDGRPPNWRHLAEDLQWLHSRQAIDPHISQQVQRTIEASRATAKGLLSAYFPDLELPSEDPPPERRGNPRKPGDPPPYIATADTPESERRLDQWLLDLGRVMAGLEKHRPRSTKGGTQ